MSNPAVIQLASTYIGDTEVRIEDNWAEAMHLHIGMMRIDLTMEEFLDISDKMILAAEQLIDAEGFSFQEFDPLFLSYYSTILPDLERVTIDKVKVGDIVILKNNKLPFYRHLDQSRDYLALKGNPEELNAYKSQVNLMGKSNLDRLKDSLNSIQEHGYPYQNQYIILRNDQNVILDGQHRASCLLYLYGPDYEIPVMRFHFKDHKYDVVDWHPWRKALVRKMIDRVKAVGRRILGTGQIDV